MAPRPETKKTEGIVAIQNSLGKLDGEPMAEGRHLAEVPFRNHDVDRPIEFLPVEAIILPPREMNRSNGWNIEAFADRAVIRSKLDRCLAKRFLEEMILK